MGLAWLALLAALLAASPTSARDFRSADIYSAEHPAVRAVRSMADDLRQRSNGRLAIDDLGEDSDFTEALTISKLRIGALDMARVHLGSLAGLVPEAIAPNLPGMFGSDVHVRKVLDGPIGDQILTALDRVGLVGLCFYDGGTRSLLSTTSPVRTPSDLAGMKVRVHMRGPWATMLEAMGARPVMMPSMQVPSALQMGVVEVEEADPATFMTGRLSRVARFYSLTEHSRSISIVLFSKRVWNTLAVDEQRLVRESAAVSVDHHRVLRAGHEAAGYGSLRATGVTIVEDVDRLSFAKATRALRTRYVSDPGALEMAAKIRAADTELAKEQRRDR